MWRAIFSTTISSEFRTSWKKSVLIDRRKMSSTRLDPRLEIRASSLLGRGTVATAPSSGDAIVIVWEHRVHTAADLPAEPQGEVWPRADGSYVWLPPNDNDDPEVDDKGRIYRVKVKDPSFVNWPALSFASLKNIVP